MHDAIIKINVYSYTIGPFNFNCCDVHDSTPVMNKNYSYMTLHVAMEVYPCNEP